MVYWPQILHAMYRNISKMADQRWPINPRIHYVVLTVTSSGCLKLYLNPWELSTSFVLSIYFELSNVRQLIRTNNYTFVLLSIPDNWDLLLVVLRQVGNMDKPMVGYGWQTWCVQGMRNCSRIVTIMAGVCSPAPQDWMPQSSVVSIIFH